MEAPGSPSRPRTVAILSDVHGNLAALRAVLADVTAREIDEIVVGGDLVGFGAQQNEVIDLLVARGAVLVRGNHEQDYVVPYSDPLIRARWRADPRLVSLCWSLDNLGPERTALLGALPEQYWLDEATLVVHGSPRYIRDAVLAETPEAELVAMFATPDASLIFVGHTHHPVIRSFPGRRIVNVGSVGAPLHGDPRASYAVAERARTGWVVELCKVDYDVEAAIAAYDDGLRAVDSGFVEIMARQLRTGRPYLGGWIKLRATVADAELPNALARYLAEHP